MQTNSTIVLNKIISGGQTGVDQAALRAAQDIGLATGGWCPPGRVCESGIIPERFPLQETPYERSENVPTVPRSLRTEWNVRDADATLIVTIGSTTKDVGTTWTQQVAQQLNKPLLLVDLLEPEAAATLRGWLTKHLVQTLNIAGPSEATVPGIEETAYQFLFAFFISNLK